MFSLEWCTASQTVCHNNILLITTICLRYNGTIEDWILHVRMWAWGYETDFANKIATLCQEIVIKALNARLDLQKWFDIDHESTAPGEASDCCQQAWNAVWLADESFRRSIWFVSFRFHMKFITKPVVAIHASSVDLYPKPYQIVRFIPALREKKQ
jgi:hypothetical protein